MGLVAHVFFATKSTTISYEFNGYLLIRKSQQIGNVIAVVPNALATGIHVQASAVL